MTEFIKPQGTPTCFGSNPQPQTVAENGCDTCAFEMSCSTFHAHTLKANKVKIDFTCPHCHSKHVKVEASNEELMREFTEFFKTRIFRQEPFDKWFFEKFGLVEKADEIKYNILHSEGVEVIDGVVMLYKSPYLITEIHRKQVKG